MLRAPYANRSQKNRRSGAAVVELAILLPFLGFLFVVAVDYSRLFYYSLTMTNCARNGALYASDPTTAALSPYRSVSAAALADAGNLSPAPTVTSTSSSDSTGNYVDVTVTYVFHTITNYPGIPSQVTLTRTVRMRAVPQTPSF